MVPTADCPMARAAQCVGPLCYDFSDVEEYMNKPETLKELGVPEGRMYVYPPLPRA